jgi:two-component system, LytTR family, response regulator
MLNAVIIDDEEHCIKTLTWTLREYCKDDINILGQYSNPEEGLAAIIEEKPDIVFLDVEMPGMSGIELLERCRNFSFEVVFTTAYNKYAIKAIKLNALDYLLKPIDKDELLESVKKLKTKMTSVVHNPLTQSSELHKIRRPDKIALSTMAGLQFVNLDDVIRVEGESNYCNFFIRDKKKILLSKKLGDAELLLKENENFFRAHKSHIINLAYVDRYIRGEGGEIVMNDGTSIALSRNKKDEFLRLFSRI